MKVLLQPASQKKAMKHFIDTVESGVQINFFKDKLSEAEFNKIQELNLKRIRIWGMVPLPNNGERKEWKNLKDDDIILFYKEKRFFYVSKVLFKIHNEELAESLWGFDDLHRTWEYIYFIKEGEEINIPYNPVVLRKLNGEHYKENHIIQGATLLSIENSQNILEDLGINSNLILDENLTEPSERDETKVAEIVKNINTPEEARKEINKLSLELLNKPVKVRIKIAKALSRNPKFSRLVKERAKYICEICGSQPFIKKNGEPYAEAHHKLELAKSRIDNPNEMICLCPTCHKIVHYGNQTSLDQRKNLFRE